MGVELPPFRDTPVEQVATIVDRVRKTFFTQKTRPVSFRLQQLRKLYWSIVDHEAEILEACQRDLHKGYYEAMQAEVTWLTNDIIFVSKNLEKWIKDEKPSDIDFTNSLVSPKIRKDPLGLVLIIGAFNFPFNLAFGPMIGAIAAGNTVVLKPPEKASNCSAVMQKIVEAALDPSCYTCIQGGIPQTKALLAEKWDKIFFTGSAGTGKIIAKAAAETLTPVTLELGGRNPAIVTKKADVRLAARRLLWSKTINAGQLCISHNYTLVDKDVAPTFIAELKSALKDFYPNGAKDSEDYSRIINLDSFNRLKKMLDNTGGKIVAGGNMDADLLFIEPTVVEVSDVNDPLLIEESFGPLLPILPVDNLEEAIKIANSIHSSPLSVYAFGSKEQTDKVLAETRSGGATVNDGLFHAVIPTMPFGGVGDSGTGAYRGKASFDCFTHQRSIARTPNWMERLLAVRYPPFAGTDKWKQFSKMGVQKPDFDRQGRVKLNFLWYLVTLGAGSLTGGVLRATTVAALAVVLRTAMMYKVSLTER